MSASASVVRGDPAAETALGRGGSRSAGRTSAAAAAGPRAGGKRRCAAEESGREAPPPAAPRGQSPLLLYRRVAAGLRREPVRPPAGGRASAAGPQAGVLGGRALWLQRGGIGGATQSHPRLGRGESLPPPPLVSPALRRTRLRPEELPGGEGGGRG